MGWPEMSRLMEVSAIFYICRYCVITWYGINRVTASKSGQNNDIILNEQEDGHVVEHISIQIIIKSLQLKCTL